MSLTRTSPRRTAATRTAPIHTSNAKVSATITNSGARISWTVIGGISHQWSSSPAKAGDPVISGLSDKLLGLCLLDAPLSRGMTTQRVEPLVARGRAHDRDG